MTQTFSFKHILFKHSSTRKFADKWRYKNV